MFYFYYFKEKSEKVLNRTVSKINDIRSGEYEGEIKIDVTNLSGSSQNNFSNFQKENDNKTKIYLNFKLKFDKSTLS